MAAATPRIRAQQKLDIPGPTLDSSLTPHGHKLGASRQTIIGLLLVACARERGSVGTPAAMANVVIRQQCSRSWLPRDAARNAGFYNAKAGTRVREPPRQQHEHDGESGADPVEKAEPGEAQQPRVPLGAPEAPRDQRGRDGRRPPGRDRRCQRGAEDKGQGDERASGPEQDDGVGREPGGERHLLRLARRRRLQRDRAGQGRRRRRRPPAVPRRDRDRLSRG